MNTFLNLLNINEDIELFNLWAEASPSFAYTVAHLKGSRHNSIRHRIRQALVDAAISNLIDAAPEDKKLDIQLLIKTVTLDSSKNSAYSIRGCSEAVREIVECFIKNPTDVEGSAKAILALNQNKTNWRFEREKAS